MPESYREKPIILLSIGGQQVMSNGFPKDDLRPGLTRRTMPGWALTIFAVLFFSAGRAGVHIRQEQEACGSHHDDEE